ncbi:winged helix-turn-helix domain-containing protein [Serratia odorifera]|uniref:winged helix-turn-helix domain-containing protein n=1 Tax=Serratia odorifera TaxID=618 RepID=UPI003531812B
MINEQYGKSEYGAVTDMHINKLYGYLIDSSVLYLPSQQQLISHRGYSCQLRNTMSELLFYLIQHSEKGVVTDDEIIINVWERNDLSGTYNRLWQVMQNLNRNLSKLGIKSNLFVRVRGKGYYLVNDKITPLYTRTVKRNSAVNASEKNKTLRYRDVI